MHQKKFRPFNLFLCVLIHLLCSGFLGDEFNWVNQTCQLNSLLWLMTCGKYTSSILSCSWYNSLTSMLKEAVLVWLNLLFLASFSVAKELTLLIFFLFLLTHSLWGVIFVRFKRNVLEVLHFAIFLPQPLEEHWKHQQRSSCRSELLNLRICMIVYDFVSIPAALNLCLVLVIAVFPSSVVTCSLVQCWH